MSELHDDVAVSLQHAVARMLVQEFGVSEDQAATLAAKPLNAYRDLFGDRVYLHAQDKQQQRLLLRRDYDGGNRDDLCRRFGISRATFYRWME